MIIKQADLFCGLSPNFIKDLMDIATRSTFTEGENIFRSGDAAEYFYILIQGCVRLHLGQSGRHVYTGCKVGEIFGWSSLIGRPDYTATAECLEPSALLRIDRQRFQRMLEADPTSGLTFFKQLAATLGNRLLQLYDHDSENHSGTHSTKEVGP